MPARMTETARRQGAKNALIVVPVFLIAMLVLDRVLVLAFGQKRLVAHGIAVAVSWGLVLLISLVSWIYGRSTAGRILLDCGPYPGKSVYLIVGIFITGLTVWFRCSHPPSSLSKVFALDGPWFEVSFAASFLVAAFGRLQVRENGIMTYWTLLPWRRIASYHWADDGTLLITKKRRLSLRVALPVPSEQKQAVDEFLTTFCPDRDAASLPGT